MSKIALLTCQHLAEADDDAQILLDAVHKRGLDAVWAEWDNPRMDWTQFTTFLIRSTWNYYLHHAEFLNWLSRIDKFAQIYNPLEIITENVHKGYLRNLGRKGIPVVPTLFFPAKSSASLAAEMGKKGWTKAVIKPAISAASYRTHLVDASSAEAHQATFDDLINDSDVMVQEYLPSVEDSGEQSLIWIDGQVTHSVRKSPRFSGDAESVSAARVPGAEELEFAYRAIRCVPGRLLYARVDLMRDQSGCLCLSELELIEPSLFLNRYPPAADRLADAIAREAAANES